MLRKMSYICFSNYFVMEFTEDEKLAVGSVLFLLSSADFRKQSSENEILAICYKELGIDVSTFEPLSKERIVNFYGVIKAMDMEKKKAFSLMMTRISRSDGNFGTLERAFVAEVLDMCEVPFVHR